MNIAYNADCLPAMREYPDNYFDLAVVDPPYGIGESGGTNFTRSKIATAKAYKAFAGMDKEPPPKEYFLELLRVSKNQIIWGGITSQTASRTPPQVAGLCGTKKTERQTSPTANWPTQASKRPLGYFALGGKECCKAIWQTRKFASTQRKSLWPSISGY